MGFCVGGVGFMVVAEREFVHEVVRESRGDGEESSVGCVIRR